MNSPHSPCGRGLPFIKNGNPCGLVLGQRLMSSGFRGINAGALFHVPLDNTFCPPALWRRPGRGAGPAKATDYRQHSGAGFAVQWSGRKRDRIVNPAPRFRRRNGTAKIRPVKGLRRKILRMQNTLRPLTGRIGVAA